MFKHIKTTGAQTGNVFLAYRNHAAVDAIIDKWKQAKSPVYDFIAEDGIQHSIWIVNDSDAVESITAVFEKEIPCTYIADGHHRAASAAKVRKQISGEVPEGANYFLTTLFPSNQLYIMDYNRVVKDLNGLSKAEFLVALSTSFDVVSMGKQMVKPEQLHTMGLYVGGEWFLLTAKPGTYSNDPIGVLDVSVLQEKILGPILGIMDQRTDKRIDLVGVIVTGKQIGRAHV